MTRIIKLNTFLILGAIFFSNSAYAVYMDDKGKKCAVPRYKSIVPPSRIKGGPVPEVEAESEISFTVSNAKPASIKIIAKKIKLKPASIVDRDKHHLVTVKLPSELNGKFARLEFFAKGRFGICESKGGWLIKIKDSGEASTNTEGEVAKDSEQTKK